MPRRKKPAFDPQTLVADIDHRDDDLLAYIAAAHHINDRFDAASEAPLTPGDSLDCRLSYRFYAAQ